MSLRKGEMKKKFTNTPTTILAESIVWQPAELSNQGFLISQLHMEEIEQNNIPDTKLEA